MRGAPDRTSAVCGPYEVVREIRSGPEGGCARGRAPDGTTVFLRWERLPSEGGRTALDGEIACLAGLLDRGVPRVLDLLRTAEFVVGVLEWVDGIPLPQAPDADAERVAKDLVRILRRTHAAGWTHGDVKPSNVLLTRDRGAVLIDWEYATRQGESARPGTPGWAAAAAWQPGFRAAAGNDVYSAAVVCWELAAKRKAFTGTVDDIVRQQASFSFDAPACIGEWTRHLYACVETGRALAPSRADLLASFDASAERAATARLPGTSCTPSGEAWRRRIDEGRTAWTLEEVGAWSRRLALACGTAGPEEARSTWLRTARKIGAALAQLPAAEILAAQSDDDAPGRVSLLAAVRRGADDRVLVTALPTPTEGWRGPRPLSRDDIRSILETILAAPEVPEGLLRAATDHAPVSSSDVHDFLCRASDGTTEMAAELSVTPSGDHVGSGRHLHSEPTSHTLFRAQCLALEGDVLSTYRLCVAVTTGLLSGSPLSADEARHLVELWLEVGNSQIVREALAVVGARVGPAFTLRTHARVAMSSGALSEVAQLSAQYEAIAEEPADRLTVCRVKAFILMSQKELDAAREALRAARSIRRTAPAWARLELALTHANVVRLAGRLERARSMLRRVEVLSREFGSMRVHIAARINSVLSASHVSEEVRAEAWDSIRESASAWGLRDYSMYAAAIGARTWMATGVTTRAKRVVEWWRQEERRSGRAPERSRHLLTAVEAAILDFAEEPAACLAAGAQSSEFGENFARVLLLKREMGVDESDDAGRSSRDDSVRAARCCLRRRNWTSNRLASVVLNAERALVRGTGLLTHCLRALVRDAGSSSGGLLAALRAEVENGRFEHRSAVMAHAIVLAWCARTATVGDRQWFVENAPADQRQRPLGVRAWEWELAHAVAAAPHSPPKDTAAAIQRVRTSLRRLVEHFKPWEPASYLMSFPGATLLELAAQRVANNQSTPAEVGTLQGVDLWLEAVQSCILGPTGRVADFERVLQTALRLRSNTSVDEVLAEAVSGVLAVCRAERAVALFDLGSGGVRAKVGCGEQIRDIPATEAEISHSVLARVRDSARAVVIDDAAAEETLGDRPSVRRYRARSIMVCPLRTPTRYLGYLYVENRSQPGSFSGADPEMLEGFSAQAALALENAALVEDLRTSYKDLSRARSEAVRAESLRVLGRMATEVAHDLNNLLTAVMGEAQLLLSDRRFQDAYASLRVIERAAQDGAECIRRIQDSTRSRPVAEFELVDLVQVVRDVLDFTRVRCAPKPGRPETGIRVEFAAPARAIVRGVPSELREVFTNLVVNAIEAMDGGGVLSVRVAAGELATVAVQDTGCGIPSEIVSRLFEPFFTTKGEKGNGLGLSIAQGVVRRHGGDISIESQVGKGTTLFVALPIVRSDIEVQAVLPPEDVRDVAKRFLIVDDDASVLRVLEQMLEQAGARVDAVIGGDAAVAKLERAGDSYDCVITDLYMPRVSGLDVADFARRVCPDTPIVVMSGCATTLESEATRARGIAQVIRKPFAFEAIRRLVSLAT